MWVALALRVALVYVDRFTMCELVVPAMVSAMLLWELSSLVARPIYLLCNRFVLP